MTSDIRIGLIGYGEVGKIFGTGLAAQPGVAAIGAWDLKFDRADKRIAERAHAGQAGVQAHDSPQGLCEASDLIISAVTASSTLAVAQAAAPHLRPGMLFLDLNSASPGTKRQCAALVEGVGAHYVEAGVMTSVPPYGIRVPMLLGGAHAAALAERLSGWGMDARVVSDRIGVTSAIKMCRSVMIKGLEALVIESFTAARALGVEQAVLASLAETFPGIDWERQGTYFFQRAVQHGRRRAEEMREVAATVREAGLEPWSAIGTAERQGWVADLGDAGAFGDRRAVAADWRVYADAILARRAAAGQH